MKRSLPLVLVVVAAAVLAGPAAAKGPSGVTITGPGMAEPVVLRDAEGNASSRIGRIVELGGWFAQAFRQSPDSTRRQPPTTRLGPRYVALWTVPTGGSSAVTIRQELYPWAVGGPVTHMRAGQRLFGTGTHGGWYRGSPALRSILVASGLPKRSPQPA